MNEPNNPDYEAIRADTDVWVVSQMSLEEHERYQAELREIVERHHPANWPLEISITDQDERIQAFAREYLNAKHAWRVSVSQRADPRWQDSVAAARARWAANTDRDDLKSAAEIFQSVRR